MRRREFLTLLGAATAWPRAARAQQPAQTVIGILNGQSAEGYARTVAAFRKALSEGGFVEGQNLAIEYRWSDGHDDRLPDLAADLVRQNVALIDCGGSPSATLAAKAATSTIPIVFSTGIDPVQSGYVESLNRPGGNIIGVAFLVAQLSAKRLGLLHQLLPKVTTMAAVFNPKHPATAGDTAEMKDAARSMGVNLHILSASTDDEIVTAFASLPSLKAGALLVGPDPVFLGNRRKIVTLAASHAIPAIYELRDFADDGGLMSYGTSITDAYYQAGIYAARILNGERAENLPVIQSTKFELVINAKTAKTLGLSVPPTLLALADEVIE
jgi:putative tryptophan/tyrosine transport system substrate-binding protein